jgi:hypothetical protein
MADDEQPLGDAHGDWYYCFTHGRAETRDACTLMDRMGPYPTKEAAENWRERVAERNAACDAEDDE